jgi:hypothetical protein
MLYEEGLSIAMSAFQEAQTTRDAETLILAEYTFLGQEQEFCDIADTQAVASLTQAIQSFDDALLVLEVVQDSASYRAVEKSYPHMDKYRVRGMPKDAFHIACIAHSTRLSNVLRTPGLNMAAAKGVYLERQVAALSQSAPPKEA